MADTNPSAPATVEHVEEVTEKQTSTLQAASDSRFGKLLVAVCSAIGLLLLGLIQNYTDRARSNPNDDVRTLAVKSLQDQVNLLTSKLILSPVPVVTTSQPPTISTGTSEQPLTKLWLPDPSGEPQKGTWVMGRVVEEKKK